MALKPLNSVGGFSVGEVPANVILPNADITANKGTFVGNVAISNTNAAFGILTDNLYYSNGVPWDFQEAAGSDTELQFNMNDNFAASANLTFNNTTQLFKVTGNANVTGVLTAGSLETDEILHGTSNVAIPTANGNVNISVGGVANVFTVTTTGSNVAGTLNATGNANVGNLGTDTAIITTGNITTINSGLLKNGTTNITLTQGGNVATFVAGNASAQFIVTATGVNVAGLANIVGNANIGNIGTEILIATGNISGANLIGPLANGTSNVSIPATNGNINTSVGGVPNVLVVTSSGANVAGTLNATGNANVGNLGTERVITSNIQSANSITLTANTSGTSKALEFQSTGNITLPGNARINTTDGNVSIKAGTTSKFVEILSGDANTAVWVEDSPDGAYIATNLGNAGNVKTWQFKTNGDLVTPASINIGANGNIVANTFIGNLQGQVANGTSNINIPVASGNINTSVNGTANVLVVTATGANIAGTINATGNANVGNLGTAGLIAATGNVSGGNLTTGGVIVATGNITGGNINTAGKVVASTLESNVAIGTAPLVVVSTTLVANLRAATAALSNTVNDAAQPNITSVGTLTGLTVNGVSNLGPNSNVIITGGTDGQFLSTNGSGNVSWTTIEQSQISNGTSNVNIPVANGNVNTSVNGTANVLVVTATGANITGTLNATSNVTGGNLTTAGVVDATGNITGGNLTTAGLVLATGNVTGGNITTAGVVAATGNVSGGNLTTAGVVAATGNVSGGNLTTAGVVAATGNVSGGNINTAGKVVASTLESNVATGTAPLVVTSTTQVANLNVATAGTAGTVTTAAQPNITSVGTLTSLDVTGNVIAGNVYANSGTIGASLLTGTLTTAAQPNITSVGTLTSLGVTGNVTTSANIVTDLIVGKTSGISITAAGTNQNITLAPTGTGAVDVSTKKISNLATPVASTDAATKQYVDEVAEGLHIHASCAAATPNTLAVISGGTVTYNNGTAGVGATLTTTGSYTTIDGVNIATVGTRILVKNQTAAAQNGIYVFTSSTVLTRATDYNTSSEIQGGDFTFVTGGNEYDSTGWVQIDAVPTVGTSPIEWVQFSGAGTFTAGTGLTLTGTVFSITNTTVTAGTYGNGDAVATFTVNAQGQLTNAANTSITANAANLTGTTLNASIINSSLTSVGTLGSLAVTGNAIAGNVYANSGTIGASLLTGTLTTAAQPNVTSVGSLTTLAVTGNANVGNLGTAGLIVATGNVTGGNLTTAGALSVTGNANVGNIGAAAGVFTANVSAGNVSLTGVVSATGNITGGNLITSGNISASVGTQIGNTAIYWGTVTTTTTSANQTISTIPVSGVTGIEWIVKATDNTGSKYSMALVTAVTNGTNVDYSTFGGVNLGSGTGTIAVNVVGSNIALQVTPSSSNSTVWVTQYRTI